MDGLSWVKRLAMSARASALSGEAQTLIVTVPAAACAARSAAGRRPPAAPSTAMVLAAPVRNSRRVTGARPWKDTAHPPFVTRRRDQEFTPLNAQIHHRVRRPGASPCPVPGTVPEERRAEDPGRFGPKSYGGVTRLYLATGDALVLVTQTPRGWTGEVQLPGLPTQCVAVDPLRPGHVVCGTFGRGVWISTDAGSSWRPAGDEAVPPHVTAVAVGWSGRGDPWGCSGRARNRAPCYGRRTEAGRGRGAGPSKTCPRRGRGASLLVPGPTTCAGSPPTPRTQAVSSSPSNWEAS